MTGDATEWLERIATDALADVTPLTERLISEISTLLPELAADPRLQTLLANTITDNVVSALRVLNGELNERGVTAPPVALEMARRAAQQRIPITSIIRAYRIGQAVFQREVLRGMSTEDQSGSGAVETALELASVVFDYVDTVTEEIVDVYQTERDTWLRHRNADRLERVQEILSGAIADVAGVEDSLGYRLTGEHVGVVLWCADGFDGPDGLVALEATVPALSGRGSPSTSLSVAPDASTLWVWVDAVGDVDDIERALGRGPAGVCASVGIPARGITGFRETHRQARRAQSVALATAVSARTPVIAASRLGPLTLLGADADDAAAWVQSVLGALATDDESHAHLRETAWHYLSSGGSLNAAASALHVHRNTVRYRVGKAEDARGRPFDDGRLDVEVALAACRQFGPTVLRLPTE